MQDSNLEVSRRLFASWLNARSQTDWAIEDQAKNLNSTARPYMMSEHSAHLNSLPVGFRTWHIHMHMHTYIHTYTHTYILHTYIRMYVRTFVYIYIYMYIVSGLKLTSLFLCLSYSQIYVQPSRDGHGKSLSLLRFSLWYLQMIGYIGRVRLVADYTISLSSLCRLIWRHWTT